MLLDNDQNIVQSSNQLALEYKVTELLYKSFFENSIISYRPDITLRYYQTLNTSDDSTHIFSIQENVTRHTKFINRKLEAIIKQLRSQLPKELYLNYEYTTYEGTFPNRYAQRGKEIVRSGYIIEIKDFDKLVHTFQDGAAIYEPNFGIKFRILGERDYIDSNFYVQNLQLRFNNSDSVYSVIDYMKEIHERKH